MKLPLLCALGVMSLSPLLAEAPKLVKLWETEPTLKVPEGVHFDDQRQVLYVSNIDGKEPWGRDGKGSIARVALDGKVRDAEWITGLNAPKGLDRAGGRLFVTDLDQLVIIDLEAGRVVERVSVPAAEKLNDVSVDQRTGAVYFTDSQTGLIHRWQEGALSVASRAFKSPNGVLADGGNIYVLDRETLHRIKGESAETVATGITGHVDGIVRDGEGFLLTCWEGMIYHAREGGQATLLLDTRPEKANAADPAYNAKERILYVPTFWKNTVVAYRVQ